MTLSFPIVVYGLGNMGGAFAKCVRKANPKARILGHDADASKLAELAEQGVVEPLPSGGRIEAGVLILAVKPQLLDSVAAELAGRVSEGVLVVSILAGVPVKRLRAALGVSRVVRVMPNLALTVGAGASAFAVDGLDPEACEVARELLSSTGEVVEVLESQLDAVTGLSGSGPAFVLKFLMALEDGGVLAGLPRPVAHRLAAATVGGTLRMATETGTDWDSLRGQVTSPGGTTIYGLKALEDNGFGAAVMSAVLAATVRSQELGR